MCYLGLSRWSEESVFVPVLEELKHRQGSWLTATSSAGDGMGPAEGRNSFLFSSWAKY